tara:strand:+ start:165 stop:419 length:255 start_codon:yes stop_codon:yes gene_type:complete
MNIKEVIALVEKYIADPKSVSQEELKTADAYVVAYADVYAAWYAADAAAISAVAAAWSAVAAALHGDVDVAKLWVAEYHKSLSE